MTNIIVYDHNNNNRCDRNSEIYTQQEEETESTIEMGYLSDAEYDLILRGSRQRILEIPEALKIVDYAPSQRNGFTGVSHTELPDGRKITTHGDKSREQLLTIIHLLVNKSLECHITDNVTRQPLSDIRYGAPVVRQRAANYLGLDETMTEAAILKAANGKITHKTTASFKCQGCGQRTTKRSLRGRPTTWCPACKKRERALSTRKWRTNKRKETTVHDPN